MPRSYLLVNKLTIDCFKADSIILPLSEILKEEVIDVLKENKKQKKIYGIIDGYRLHDYYDDLYKIDYSICDGWWIINSSRRTLNRLTIKARDVEKNLGLYFGVIKFISSVSSPKEIVLIKDHASYDRVNAVCLDYEGYFNNLGLDYDLSQRTIERINNLRNYLSMKIDLTGVDVIETYSNLFSDGFDFGYYAGFTKDLGEVDEINVVYTPNEKKIQEAKFVLDCYVLEKRKTKKHFYLNNRYYSLTYLSRLNRIKQRAEYLGLIEKSNYELVTKKKYLKIKPKEVSNKKFYTLGEEIANSCTHGVGVALSIAILVMLLIFARSSTERLAFGIFGVSSILLYLISTLYHAFPANTKTKNLFQRFDHMSIYLLIAGTYTPFTLIILDNKMGILVCIYQWVTALIGILLNAICFRKFKILHMVLYVMLGWTAILFLPEVYTTLGLTCTLLLLIGGISYTVGIAFYSLKLVKYTHTVWHVFVIAGTVLQFLSLLFYVM